MLSNFIKVITSLALFSKQSYTFDVQTNIVISNFTFANICGSSIFNLNCLEFCPYGLDIECKTPGFTCFKANLNQIINTCNYNNFCGNNGVYNCLNPCPSGFDRECFTGSCFKLPPENCGLTVTTIGIPATTISPTTLPVTTIGIPATTISPTTLPVTTIGIPATTLPVTTIGIPATTNTNRTSSSNTTMSNTTSTMSQMVNDCSKNNINFMYFLTLLFLFTVNNM